MNINIHVYGVYACDDVTNLSTNFNVVVYIWGTSYTVS